MGLWEWYGRGVGGPVAEPKAAPIGPKVGFEGPTRLAWVSPLKVRGGRFRATYSFTMREGIIPPMIGLGSLLIRTGTAARLRVVLVGTTSS